MKDEKRNINIELRSEKMQKIINAAPKKIIYWGVIIVILIIAAILITFFTIPHPSGSGESFFHYLFL